MQVNSLHLFFLARSLACQQEPLNTKLNPKNDLNCVHEDIKFKPHSGEGRWLNVYT